MSAMSDARRGEVPHPKLTFATVTAVRLILLIFAGVPWALLVSAAWRAVAWTLALRRMRQSSTISPGAFINLCIQAVVVASLTALTVVSFIYANVSLVSILR